MFTLKMDLRDYNLTQAATAAKILRELADRIEEHEFNKFSANDIIAPNGCVIGSFKFTGK
jgi:hypothetical protein